MRRTLCNGKALYQNALDSVYALTDTTAKVLEAYQYDAYGYQTVMDPGPSGSVVFGPGDVVTPGGASQVGNPFLFTGQQLDPETGLYYDRARYMDAVQGRFLQRDPLGDAGNTNLYEYAGDSPVNKADPTGLQAVTPADIAALLKKRYDDQTGIGGFFRALIGANPQNTDSYKKLKAALDQFMAACKKVPALPPALLGPWRS